MKNTRVLGVLVVAFAALIALYLVSLLLPSSTMRLGERSERPMPVATEESARVAAAPQSFQHLVSVTARGFEPKTLIIRTGETVRFVNNTKESVTLVGARPFSEATLAPHDFAEFTFENAGGYPYSDGGTKRAGVVQVE